MNITKNKFFKIVAISLSIILSFHNLPLLCADNTLLTAPSVAEINLKADITDNPESLKIQADNKLRIAIEEAKNNPEQSAEILSKAIDERNEQIKLIGEKTDLDFFRKIVFPKLTRREFSKIAAFIALGLRIDTDKIFAKELQKFVEEQPFTMSTAQMSAVLKFMLTNRTKGGMPLSYKVPKGFWRKIGHSANDMAAITERLLAENSLTIYDSACGQIAESLMGNTNLADKHTKRLLSGRSGDLSDIRAQTNFTFNGKKFGNYRNNKGWFFRIISDKHLQPDPLDGKRDFRGFGDWNKLCHNDWKPIGGENAWAAMIGPLQVAYKKYGDKIPLNCDELKLALSILECTDAMQSPIGAIYHAPEGTEGKDPRDISNENNISIFAALQMLLQVLESYQNQPGVNDNIKTIRKVLYGEGADDHGGILGYFKDYAFNKKEGVFYQGGFYINGRFKPTVDFAVDVQTWGILVFGPELIDQWYGEGTAYKNWQNTKRRAGYFDRKKVLRGIGYTGGHDISSAEWGFGAIMMLRSLSQHYEKTRSAWSKETIQDSITMRRGIEKDLYDKVTGSYLYANKRYYIRFGWWANPIPSLTSSAWAIMVDKNYNPFVLGGGKAVSPSVVLAKKDTDSTLDSADNEKPLEGLIIEGNDLYKLIRMRRKRLFGKEPDIWNQRGGQCTMTQAGTFICQGPEKSYGGVNFAGGEFADFSPYKTLQINLKPLNAGAEFVIIKIYYQDPETKRQKIISVGMYTKNSIKGRAESGVHYPGVYKDETQTGDIATVDISNLGKINRIAVDYGRTFNDDGAQFNLRFGLQKEKQETKPSKPASISKDVTIEGEQIVDYITKVETYPRENKSEVTKDGIFIARGYENNKARAFLSGVFKDLSSYRNMKIKFIPLNDKARQIDMYILGKGNGSYKVISFIRSYPSARLPLKSIRIYEQGKDEIFVQSNEAVVDVSDIGEVEDCYIEFGPMKWNSDGAKFKISFTFEADTTDDKKPQARHISRRAFLLSGISL